jgi:hypothetical protein
MSIADEPVGYIERTRQYYRALGYERDYVWAHFNEVPFAKFSKPLRDCRIALITTAAPPDFDGNRKLWSGSAADPPERLKTRTSPGTRNRRIPMTAGHSYPSKRHWHSPLRG